jgi:N-formylglutamate amidohydrolase
VIIPGVLEIVRPSGLPCPVLFDLPHSGRDYPEDFGSALPLDILRRGEDAYVDRLLADAPASGVTVLKALFPRCYIDPNRDEDDVDPTLVVDPPAGAFRQSDKSRRGIGLIRRDVVPEHRIYDRLLRYGEVTARVARYHRPYHEALATQLKDLRGMFGAVCHVDWHSMKSVGNANTPDGPGVRRRDFVIGDLHGTACDPGLTGLVARSLRDLGYSVSVNDPYAGGGVLRRHADPAGGIHSMQIEINRALYLDEARVEPTPEFAGLQADLTRLSTIIADWAAALAAEAAATP